MYLCICRWNIEVVYLLPLFIIDFENDSQWSQTQNGEQLQLHKYATMKALLSSLSDFHNGFPNAALGKVAYKLPICTSVISVYSIIILL